MLDLIMNILGMTNQSLSEYYIGNSFYNIIFDLSILYYLIIKIHSLKPFSKNSKESFLFKTCLNILNKKGIKNRKSQT